MNKAMNFCSKYLKGVETKFNRPERNPDLIEDSGRAQLSIFKSIDRSIRKASNVLLEEKQRRVAEWYILNNCEEVQPYLE